MRAQGIARGGLATTLQPKSLDPQAPWSTLRTSSVPAARGVPVETQGSSGGASKKAIRRVHSGKLLNRRLRSEKLLFAECVRRNCYLQSAFGETVKSRGNHQGFQEAGFCGESRLHGALLLVIGQDHLRQVECDGA